MKTGSQYCSMLFSSEFGPYFTDTYCTPWGSADQHVQLVCGFNLSDNSVTWTFPEDKPKWTVLLDSAESRWSEDTSVKEVPDSQQYAILYNLSVIGAGVKVLEAADPGMSSYI